MFDRRTLLQSLAGGLAAPLILGAQNVEAVTAGRATKVISDLPDYRLVRELSEELLKKEINQRPVFDFVPIQNRNETYLSWEMVLPSQDTVLRLRHPECYGEYLILHPDELARAGGSVVWEDLLYNKLSTLIGRRFDRIEHTIWHGLLNGCCGPRHDPCYFPYRTERHSGRWKPLDFAKLADWLGRERLPRATILMNQVTFNRRFEDQLPECYSRLSEGYPDARLDLINAIMWQKQLPRIAVCYQGYFTPDIQESAGQRQRSPSGYSTELTSCSNGAAAIYAQSFIPDGVAVVFAERGHQPLGEYLITRNANNPDLAPGPYTRIIEKSDQMNPGEVEIHDGHNGGFIMYKPCDYAVLYV
jgi:hypothetical protein